MGLEASNRYFCYRQSTHTQLELEEGAYCFYSAAAIISIGVAAPTAMMPSSLFPLKRLSQFSTEHSQQTFEFLLHSG